MLNIKKMLVPVDFSATSKMAVNYGLSLALEFQAKLVLAHIVVYDPHAYDEAKAHLLELIPAESREKVNFEIIVKSGDVRGELLGIVKDIDIDLVVMGTHGRSTIERLLIGSVTERMLRKLPVPVLTVSHLDPEREMHKPGPIPLRRILYATDLSDDSEPGLAFAIRLARELDARLTVTHVVEPINTSLLSTEMATHFSEFSVNIRAEAEERLNRFVALQSDGTVPTTTVLAEGFPVETINKIAARCKADLIVINLQSRGLLDRALLGSTAERVIRTATVPVLSLPLPPTYASRWAAA